MLVFAPQPSFHFHQQSPRQRYLQALAEEQAARKAYACDVLEQYSTPYGCSYEDEREARIREYYRQQHLAAARAEHQRQQEEQRRRHIIEQQRLAHLERENYVAPMMGQMFHRPQQHSAPVNEDEGLKTQSLPLAPQVVKPSRPAPTWQQKQEAASTIQDFYRKHLVRRTALSQLASLRQSFLSTKDSFTFPLNPEFDPEQTSPRLLYTAYNAPIHSFEDSLVKLLSRLDEVESAGDVEIRKARKALAREIETCLEGVDKLKEDAWKTQQEIRVLAALPSVESEMADVATIPEVLHAESRGEQQQEELSVADNFTASSDNLLTTGMEIEDEVSPALDNAGAAQKDDDAALDVSKPEASTLASVTSSEPNIPSSPPHEIPRVENSHSHSESSHLPSHFTHPEASSAATNESSQDSSPTLDPTTSSGSSSPRMYNTFLSQPFDAPGSASALMASLPILNDDIEQREVEDIVFVEAEAEPSLEMGSSSCNEEHKEGSTDGDSDDFVVVL